MSLVVVLVVIFAILLAVGVGFTIWALTRGSGDTSATGAGGAGGSPSMVAGTGGAVVLAAGGSDADWSAFGGGGSSNTPVVNSEISPHCGLTKEGALSYVKLKCSDCYSGTAIDFAKLDKAIGDAGTDTNCIVRLYFNNGKGENYLPDWMQSAADYTSRETDLADWGSATVREGVLVLLAKLAAHLAADNRVSLFQWGVGYWSEFHVAYVDLAIGENWPTADYLDEMAEVLEANGGDLQMALSVGVGDMERPISDKFRKNTRFGLFYDTFLQDNGDAEPEYITTLYKNANWEARAKRSVIGGEFANNTPALTSTSLKKAQGYIDKRHMSYLLPNGTSDILKSGEHVQTLSKSMGYGLQLATKDATAFTVTNTGVAPVFYDMYVYINGTQLPTSLKGLQRGETKEIKGALAGTPVIKGPRYATDVPYAMA